jgi:hypothetical protein
LSAQPTGILGTRLKPSRQRALGLGLGSFAPAGVFRKIAGRIKKFRTMKVTDFLYQLWHYGMMCLLYNMHFQNIDFTQSEIFGLPILFLMFIAGLFYYYKNRIIDKKAITLEAVSLIVAIELILFIIIEMLIFLLGWRLDSPPG